MHLPRSTRVVPDLTVLDEVGSTNAELVARATAGALPDFTVVATTNQTAGRGRLGRTWVAPPGTTIAVSVLLAPQGAPLERLGWVPLLAGLAMCRAVRGLLPDASDDAGPVVGLKWPNDVLVEGRKVSGILAEVVPGAAGVVIGAGLNLTMTAEQLPVPTATSLTLVGAEPDDLVDRALAAYLGELRELLSEFEATGFDAASGLRAAVLEACTTIGSLVRVERPAGDVHGRAVDIDTDGRLVLETDSGTVAMSAGDVTHLRGSA